MNVSVQPRQSIRFRGRSLLALVLAPQPPLFGWLEAFTVWIERSPGFFRGRPVVLDASGLDISEQELKNLVAELAEMDVRLMGIEGVDASWLGLGMPPPIGGGLDTSISVASSIPEKPQPEAAPVQARSDTPSLVIDEPVRSGQAVSFPEGDVTVVGSVASGAEVIAGGSIHIYGTLRGRAIAGATGTTGARIFCSKLQAELLAIDGLYRMADDINPEFRNRGIHAWLDQDALRIAALT